MTFDDRLSTVLASPATSAHDRAVRWRQLVDLISRAGADAQGPLIDRAIASIRTGQAEVDQPMRAAAARAIAGRELPDPLLEIFAADALDVAAPLLSADPPSEGVRSAASPDVRRFLDALYPPPPGPMLGGPSPDLPPLPPSEDLPTISEVVERIERLRSMREGRAPPVPNPVPPADAAPTLPELAPPPAAVEAPTPAPRTQTPAERSTISEVSPALFRWECGPGGEIGWVEGAPRGPLVGRSIARADRTDGVDREVERAFARRAPFRDERFALADAGLVAGTWLISGVPAFAPDDGRFVGYRGIARRAEALQPAAMVSAPATADAAVLRELVHEIKTPLNAIIGFAEIIDGQYLGPAQSGYRARAAEIVTQARLLLGAIDDLDFAARMRARDRQPGKPEDFAAFFPAFVERLEQEAAKVSVSLVVDSAPPPGSCMLDRQLAERLIDRFATALVAVAAAAETLRLAVRREQRACTLRITRPHALEGLSEAQLFGAESNGSSLRLIMGLAQIVGGALETDGGDLVLRLPTVG